jgi:hypothetical protein
LRAQRVFENPGLSNAELYRAQDPNQGLLPADHPEAWEKLELPADDRSPYAAMGMR